MPSSILSSLPLTLLVHLAAPLGIRGAVLPSVYSNVTYFPLSAPTHILLPLPHVALADHANMWWVDMGTNHTHEEKKMVFCWFSKQTWFFKVIVSSDARGGWGWERARPRDLVLVAACCGVGESVMWCYVSLNLTFLSSLSPKFAALLYLPQDARHKGWQKEPKPQKWCWTTKLREPGALCFSYTSWQGLQEILAPL